MNYNDIPRMETHAHSFYSNLRLLDSICRPRDMITTAAELNLKGICLTDHECLSGAVEWLQFEKELKEKEIIPKDFKCGLGNEIYLVNERAQKQSYYHFILIAKDTIGFRQLCKLSSQSWYNSYYDRGMERVPTLKKELETIVRENPGHLIATNACLAGELQSNILALQQAENRKDEEMIAQCRNNVNRFLEFCLSLFGSDFYIEVAPGLSKEQVYYNKRVVSIARHFGIKMIYGVDAHYLKKSDRFVHKAYLNSKEGEREVDSFYEFSHLMDNNEAFGYLFEAGYDDELCAQMCANSMEIYDKIQSYEIFHNPIIPHVDVKVWPQKDTLSEYPVLHSLFMSENVQERYWINECWAEMVRRGFNTDVKYVKRLETEADVIQTIGTKWDVCLFEYFNTFHHFINLFWECGSIVGPGRGSSVCFLSNMLLGITQLDPVKWTLNYWRFLNKERIELPKQYWASKNW